MCADGNCLFRAIADQVSGDDGNHESLRSQTVTHMKSNPDDFSPFVEDDESFEDYLTRMGQVLVLLCPPFLTFFRSWEKEGDPDSSSPRHHHPKPALEYSSF